MGIADGMRSDDLIWVPEFPGELNAAFRDAFGSVIRVRAVLDTNLEGRRILSTPTRARERHEVDRDQDFKKPFAWELDQTGSLKMLDLVRGQKSRFATQSALRFEDRHRRID